MADWLVYSSLLLTISLAVAAFFRARAAIAADGATRSSSRRFGVTAVAAGLASGVLYFYGILWLCDALGAHVNVGHGEVLIAAPLLNTVLGAVLAAIGRVILLWEPVG
jgi:hypothetical protein